MLPPNAKDRDGHLIRASKKQVLLVEDSWHVATAIQAVLEQMGLAILGPAASLSRAEALLALSLPDAAIIDLNIKRQMSYALVDRLLAAQVPVLIVSGYADLGPLEGRVAAMLDKPLDAKHLRSALERILPLEGGG